MRSYLQSATGAVLQYEVPPQQRTYLLPAHESLELCQAGCRGLPTMAYLSCMASCGQGIDLAAGERNPVPFPEIAQAFGTLAGAAKWLVVGLVAFAVIRVAGLVR